VALGPTTRHIEVLLGGAVAAAIFNIAKGRIAYYAGLPATNDAIVALLLKSAGLPADAALVDYDNVQALLAGPADECDATNYVRKVVTGLVVTVDDANERIDIDCDDPTWTGLGGATNNSLAKIVFCYNPDTTGGTDADLVPLSHHDLAVTTDGTSLAATVAATGLQRAA
jgi:hypothetical protein